MIRFGGSVVLSISQAIGSGIYINRCMESANSRLISPRKQNFHGCAETGNELAFAVKLKHQTSSSVSETAHARPMMMAVAWRGVARVKTT